MKFPNLGWMRLRCIPILPRPAATATGLWLTTHVLRGKLFISMGNPMAGLIARTPAASSLPATLRPTSSEWSPVW